MGESKQAEKKEEGKKEEDKKEEPKVSNIEVIKKMDIQQTKKTVLDSSSLEEIFSTWYNQVDSQADSFKKCAKRLKEDELMLYDNITTLDSLRQYSEKIAHEYETTLDTMQGIANQQQSLMNLLDGIESGIEDELSYKNQKMNSLNILRGVFTPDHTQGKIQGGNYRQQLDQKASIVNENLNNLESVIQSMSKVLSVTENESNQADSQDSSTVDKILNHTYESLRWIQDHAIDLNYQMELLEQELEHL